MNSRSAVIVTSWLMFSAPSMASEVQPGDKMPAVDIDKHGELLLDRDERMRYQPWNSQAACGRPQVLQHMAARLSVKDMNKPFTDTLEARMQETYGGQFLVSTIVNLDDALWGTGVIVESQLKSNKKKYPDSVFVVDKSGKLRRSWGLQKKSSAIFIVTSQCEVTFVHEGPLSESQIDQALRLLEQDLQNGEG